MPRYRFSLLDCTTVLFEHNVSPSKQLELISEAVSVSNIRDALYVCAYATHGARIIIQSRFTAFRSTMPTAGNCGLRKFNAGIVSACIVGLGLSFYAYNVKIQKEQDDSYEAMCDISEHISCTKVFVNEYGRGFGLFPKDSVFNISNSIYGLAFYALFAVLSTINNYACSAALVILGILSNICSIYLSHILYLLKDICVVCISTYIVNAALTFLAVKKFRKIAAGDTLKKKTK